MSEQVPEGTAGTPTQEGGDAAQPTTGTPAPEGRNAPEDERWKEALQWKAKAERVNEVEARLAEMEARQTPAADADTDDPVLDHVLDAQAAIEQAKAQGARPPKWAVHDVATYQRQKQLEVVVTEMYETMPEDKRAALSLYAKRPDLYGSPKAAAEAIRAKQLDARVKALEAEKAELETRWKRDTANRVDPNIPATDTREGARANDKPKMTGTDYDAKLDRLYKEGKASEARELQRKYMKGDIVIS